MYEEYYWMPVKGIEERTTSLRARQRDNHGTATKSCADSGHAKCKAGLLSRMASPVNRSEAENKR